MALDLEIPENNLYVNGSIVDFGDEQILQREKLVIIGTELDTYHTVKDEDRLDLIANKRYSGKVPDASKYWWVIADANNIQNPLDLSDLVGSEILIPDILTIKLEL